MLKMIYYEDLLEKAKSIEECILTRMTVKEEDAQEYDTDSFCKHLIMTKQWFLHISWINKKQFLINLIKELNIQTVAQLLKSIWNCKTKDTIMSTSQRFVWSSYDQVPLDNNRTAQPKSTLREVIAAETQRFLTLDAVHQTLYLSELLTVAGGPLMWEVLRQCRNIYDQYAEEENLLDGPVVTDAQEKIMWTVAETQKKEQPPPSQGKGSVPRGASHAKNIGPDHEQKELEALLASWSAKMKTMRDNIRLQEMEVTLSDGTKRNIWKNKSKSDSQESVDEIQLLPSYIGKKILMYLPPNQWGDCAHVNKYWAYLVDEIRSEIVTRNKLTIEMNKMRDNIIRHNIQLDVESPTLSPVTSTTTSISTKKMRSIRDTSRKSKNKKPMFTVTRLDAQLCHRGAADARLWTWCAKILKFYKEYSVKESRYKGLTIFGDSYFPCPMMQHSINLPLNPPLSKDPTNLC